jgi:outer membrane protein, heavy metal efflux system
VSKFYLLFSFLLLAVPVAPGQRAQPGRRAVTGPAPEIPADLDLPQAEQLLWERSLSIVASRYQLDASQPVRLIAGYKPNPFLQLDMEQIPVRSPLVGSYPRFVTTNPDAGANAVYTARFNKIWERGGKREYRIEQAEQVVAAARTQIDDTYRRQLFALRQAFAAALLARDNLQLAQSLDENYQRVQELTETRVKAGSLAQIELSYAQAMIDSRNAYEQAVQDILNLLTARPPDAPFSEKPTTETATLMTGPQEVAVLRAGPTLNIKGSFTDSPISRTLAQLRDLALQQRPDVIQARANLEAAQAATRLAQAQRRRDLSVGVEYQRVGSDDPVGIVAQVPLFLYYNQKALSSLLGGSPVSGSKCKSWSRLQTIAIATEPPAYLSS